MGPQERVQVVTWQGDLRDQVLHEFRESARLKGAKTPDSESVKVGEREAEVARVRRRIVGTRRM
jgi:hypothetical protein